MGESSLGGSELPFSESTVNAYLYSCMKQGIANQSETLSSLRLNIWTQTIILGKIHRWPYGMWSFLHASTHSLTTSNKLLLSKARNLPSDLPRLSYYSLLMFYLCAPLYLSRKIQFISPREPSNYFLNVPSVSLYIFLALKTSPVRSSPIVMIFCVIQYISIPFWMTISWISHVHTFTSPITALPHRWE